jgi:aconitate hydratase
MKLEFQRNHERYQFMKWGMQAFDTFRVVPPGFGICHQVNLEYLAAGVHRTADGLVYPDTLVGTDSHTTMINGIGVVGWGVGGIEAEAAMLGQPVYFLTPDVVGFELKGRLREGCTATDLVLTVTEILRQHKVVGKFVEFFGEGTASLSVPDRATIGNMAPEYGATMGFSGRRAHHRILRGHGPHQGRDRGVRGLLPRPGPVRRRARGRGRLLAGHHAGPGRRHAQHRRPARPQDRIELGRAAERFQALFSTPMEQGGFSRPAQALDERVRLHAGDAGPDAVEAEAASAGCARNVVEMSGNKPVGQTHATRNRDSDYSIGNGDVLIAAITSCTNTSNPSVMLAAGLLAKKAVEAGLKVSRTSRPRWRRARASSPNT